MTVGVFASCSKDDETSNPSNDSLTGSWKFSKSYVNYYDKDKKFIKTLNVRNTIDNDNELFNIDEAVIYMKAVEFQEGSKYKYTSTFDSEVYTGTYSISNNIIDFQDKDNIDNFEYKIENGILTTDNIGQGKYLDITQYKPSAINIEAKANMTSDYKYWRMFVEYKR